MGGTLYQRDFVKKTVLDSWQPLINLKLRFIEGADSDIRVAFDASGGAWSYIGTQNMHIPKTEPTMNLGWLDDNLSGGVVKHEFGHMIGFAHEHMRSDEEFKWNTDAVLKEFAGPPNNWSAATTKTNILDTVNTSQFIGTTYDDQSVMVYIFDCSLFTERPASMPCGTGSIQELSQRDKATASTIYPLSGTVDIQKLTGAVITDTGGFIAGTSNRCLTWGLILAIVLASLCSVTMLVVFVLAVTKR